MQEGIQAALSGAGLPADYQTVPMLNFGNIASEQEGEQSIKLLDDIYQRLAAAGVFFPQRGGTGEIPGFQSHRRQ